MMENFDHILLFKTNIQCEQEKQKVCNLFKDIDGVEQCTVDMDDEDRVLRIISFKLKHEEVISLIKNNGHECCKLT